MISITGTNGKSSVANFFIQILKQCNKTAASIGTLGVNSMGTNIPLTNTTLDPLSLNKILENLEQLKKMLVLLSKERKVVLSHHKTFQHVEKMQGIVNESIEMAKS